MKTTRGVPLRALVLVSGEEGTAGRDGPAHARPKVLRAADAFDRRDHVLSAPAYELHVRATASSAARDQPGFVPDGYLAGLTGQDLGRPGADPEVLAAELRSAGLWRRTDGGHRVLDWPAIYACMHDEQERRAVDRRPPAPADQERRAP